MRRGLEKGKGQGNQVGKDMQIVPTVEPILKPTELSDWLRYWCGCGFLEKATPNWGKAFSPSKEATKLSSASAAKKGMVTLKGEERAASKVLVS